MKRELKLLSDKLKNAPKRESPKKAKQNSSNAAANGEKNGDVEMLQDEVGEASQKPEQQQERAANNGKMELD